MYVFGKRTATTDIYTDLHTLSLHDSLPIWPNPVASGARPPDFRVHDLSRRWVEFQMANSFKNSGVALEQAASGSAGSEGSAASAEWLPPAPAIPVPAWMRGGASFDFAANRFEPGCGVLPYRPDRKSVV